MIKIIVFLTLFTITLAQRPSYAGTSPKGYPELASRFRDQNETTSSTPGLGNRVGEDGSTPKIPVDARGDYDLVNRLNTWPKENRPFWLINAEHIETVRNQSRLPINQQQNLESRLGTNSEQPLVIMPTNTNSRAPFAGQPSNNQPITTEQLPLIGDFTTTKPIEGLVNRIGDRNSGGSQVLERNNYPIKQERRLVHHKQRRFSY